MPVIENEGKIINIDDNGFLLNQDDWSEEVALVLAYKEGFESLSTEQLDIISFMREYFLKYKVFKMFSILNNVNQIECQSKICAAEKFINTEKAWKIVGLPKNDGVDFVSLDDGKNYTMDYFW